MRLVVAQQGAGAFDHDLLMAQGAGDGRQSVPPARRAAIGADADELMALGHGRPPVRDEPLARHTDTLAPPARRGA